jgi:hypothetical protein
MITGTTLGARFQGKNGTPLRSTELQVVACPGEKDNIAGLSCLAAMPRRACLFERDKVMVGNLVAVA